jgi:hypothetical protein
MASGQCRRDDNVSSKILSGEKWKAFPGVGVQEEVMYIGVEFAYAFWPTERNLSIL